MITSSLPLQHNHRLIEHFCNSVKLIDFNRRVQSNCLFNCYHLFNPFVLVVTTFSCGLFWSSRLFLTCCHDLFLRVVLVVTTFSCGLFFFLRVVLAVTTFSHMLPRPFLAGCLKASGCGFCWFYSQPPTLWTRLLTLKLNIGANSSIFDFSPFIDENQWFKRSPQPAFVVTHVYLI